MLRLSFCRRVVGCCNTGVSFPLSRKARHTNATGVRELYTNGTIHHQKETESLKREYHSLNGETPYNLCFLRHGQSTWNRDNRFIGWTDTVSPTFDINITFKSFLCPCNCRFVHNVILTLAPFVVVVVIVVDSLSLTMES